VAGSVWILELLRTISMLHLNYHITITDPLIANAGSVHTWSLVAVVGICSALDAIFQVYYALRIKMLIKRWELPILCWCISFVQLSIVLAILPLLAKHTFATFFTHYRFLLITAVASRTTLDVLGTASLWFYLPKSEEKLSIQKYALLFVESGTITSLLGVIMLATLLGDPSTYVWLAIALVLGIAEMNCFFAGLNSRHLWTSGLPLVDLGKTPTVLTFYHPQKVTNLEFGVQVEKSSSSGSSMIEDRCSLPPK